MAVAVDQAFSERLRRIETGRQWVPDGVVVGGPRKAVQHKSAARKEAGYAGVLALLLVGVLAFMSLNGKPELQKRIAEGDLTAVASVIPGFADG